MMERFIALAVIALSLLAYWYHLQWDETRSELTTITQQLHQTQGQIDALESMSASNAAIDKQHQEDLASAKADNDRLRADVERGVKRLRLAATCEPVRNSSTTTSGANDARARLNDAAKRNYYTLRERIAQATSQINGLKSYILHQCQASTGRL